MRRLRSMNEENNIEQVEETVVPSVVEEEISPENQRILEEFQEALEEARVSISEVEISGAVVVHTTTVEENEDEEESTPELPLGYDNLRLCCGYGAIGTPDELENAVNWVKAGTWYIVTSNNRSSAREISNPDSGAWKIKIKECNAGITNRTRDFWVNNYWAQRFTEADAIGRPIALANHTEIPSNSNSLLVDNTTSRFSGAIWYENLQTKRIILAGVGGIGSYLGFLLARMKPYKITIYDNDIVEEVNMSGQLYGLTDLGKAKVDALSSMVSNYADYHNVIALNTLFTEENTSGDIMICGFDNMSARKIFFERWHRHVMSKSTDEERSKCLFIDGRLAAEELQVLAIQGNDLRAMSEYATKWIFDDEEADATVCSYKQTTFMANMIASIMTNIFVNFVANECNPIIPRDVPFYTSYAADTMYFKVEM